MSLQTMLDSLPAHYLACARVGGYGPCDCTATADIKLTVQRLFEAREHTDVAESRIAAAHLVLDGKARLASAEGAEDE